MSKMRALKWFAEKNKVELIDVDKPQTVHHDNVLIKVIYCGVCGTDLHIMLKEFAAAEEVIMGHEISGKLTRTCKHSFRVMSRVGHSNTHHRSTPGIFQALTAGADPGRGGLVPGGPGYLCHTGSMPYQFFSCFFC